MTQTLVFFSPPFLFRPSLFTILPFKIPISSFSCHCSSSPLSTEHQVLKSIAESSDETTLPCVRTYENHSALLSLVGSVEAQQALTAAAADGGRAADEHVAAGMDAMIVETVFPGQEDEHSTVSTRLFLPSRKVKEKAGKLRRSLGKDFMSGTSTNILAMTFRQVVLQRLWNFELVLFEPGTERNMRDLQSKREVSAYCTLSSSKERVISVLAEAVCICSLQITERNFLDKLMGKSSTPFRLFRKPKKFASKDSSIIIYKLFEDEMVENAESLLESFKSAKESGIPIKSSPGHHRWTPSAQSKLEKIGGPEFSAWMSEYVPVYKLYIDAGRLTDVKFEGWKKCGENKWEILLTHSQMVGLANVLDMYYEDVYTIPSKQLPCNEVANYGNLTNKKKSSSLFKMLSVIFACGVFLVIVSAFGQLSIPYLPKNSKRTVEPRSTLSAEIYSVPQISEDPSKLESFCDLVIHKIKDAFGWSGNIRKESKVGTWTGELPAYLRRVVEADIGVEANSSVPLDMIDEDAKLSAQEIASYQVVLSSDGKIIGFQPMSQVAVNHWASNPLAKELYGGRKLSPGLIEPGLKIQNPGEVFVIELLVSTSPQLHFALARPFGNVT